MGAQSRVSSWKLLGGAAVALLLMGSACVFWWFASTADLEAIRALARKQGVATTWEEFRPGFAPDTTLVTQFNRLAALSKKLDDYDTQLNRGKIGFLVTCAGNLRLNARRQEVGLNRRNGKTEEDNQAVRFAKRAGIHSPLP